MHMFFEKNARTKPIKNPYYKLDCYDLLLHNDTEEYKNIGSQRVYTGPQGLAFCSGNSDRDS